MCKVPKCSHHNLRHEVLTLVAVAAVDVAATVLSTSRGMFSACADDGDDDEDGDDVANALVRFYCCFCYCYCHNVFGVVVRVSSDVSMRTNVRSRHSKHNHTYVCMSVCINTSPPAVAH